MNNSMKAGFCLPESLTSLMPSILSSAIATGMSSGDDRRIVHKTTGSKHGPINRLISPSDLGQVLKPFVFLDAFQTPAGVTGAFKGFGWHPRKIKLLLFTDSLYLISFDIIFLQIQGLRRLQ